ncbi:MMP14 protein, partial [Acromyrmex charruanus]
MPRCGLPDILHHEHNTDTKKWVKTHLTWNFYLADVHTLKTTAFAFSLWAANSSLSFQRKPLNPDILISYRSGTHTYADRKRNEEICSSSFDGPGGVLAHAFYPTNVVNYTAEIHVDSTEQWHIYITEKSASNQDYLLNTLTHEIEHALGLTHSSREDSIMFAFVTANNSNKIIKLNIEDILAIQQLYGIKNPKPTTTTQPPTSTTTEITTNKPEYVDLCTLQYMDTILVLHHRIFVTYQRYVWSIGIDDTKYDGPHILNSYMDFLPENTSLSAAYQRPSGELVLFINGRYINSNLYFAKKQQFYTFNEFTRTVTEAGKFNLNVLNVECSKDGLLQQMQDILGRLIRSSNTH